MNPAKVYSLYTITSSSNSPTVIQFERRAGEFYTVNGVDALIPFIHYPLNFFLTPTQTHSVFVSSTSPHILHTINTAILPQRFIETLKGESTDIPGATRPFPSPFYIRIYYSKVALSSRLHL